MKIRLFIALAVACVGTAGAAASAESLHFVVMDQNRHPLKDAVVEVETSVSGVTPVSLAPAVMDQRSKRFEPELLVVQQGQQVRFPNSDNIRHHVYSFSPAKSFELKLYSGHPESPVFFDRPGVVVLGCNIHDAMVGYIYVAASAQVAVTAEDGRGEIILAKPVPTRRVFVWHAQHSAGPESRAEFSTDKNAERLPDGSFVLSLDIATPAPRDTFQAKFRAADK